MAVWVGTEVIGTHLVVPRHGRIIRKKEHFAGLLGETMRCNAQHGKPSRPFFRMIAPQVEHRSLAVYDTFADEVRP